MKITLITNDSPRQTIPISVVANIQGAVAATPSIIATSPASFALGPGPAPSKVVHVRSGSPFKITQLEASKTDLKAVEQNAGLRIGRHAQRDTSGAGVDRSVPCGPQD